MTVSAGLPAAGSAARRTIIEPVMDGDIVPVSDGHRACPPGAATTGVRHEALDLSGAERVRDAFHIRTVNGRHGRSKGFLRRYRGIATRYLDNYLQWFQHIELENASSRTCLAAAIDRSCMRFVNWALILLEASTGFEPVYTDLQSRKKHFENNGSGVQNTS